METLLKDTDEYLVSARYSEAGTRAAPLEARHEAGPQEA